MENRLALILAGQVFADELHANVGASTFALNHDWFTQQDLVIRTGAAGGGTLLVLNTDYQLSEESVDDTTRDVKGLSTRTGKTVYHKIQVINAAYQTGNLYFSGKYIADSISAELINYILSGSRPKGHLHGLVLANNGTDPTNDIDVAAGECVDNGDATLMVLASLLTKKLDVGWAVGNNQGGLFSGAIADGTYHVFLIKRMDTGVVDGGFSTSLAASDIPSGYTKYRRVGSIVRSAGSILGFLQDGDLFEWKSPTAETTIAGLSNVAQTITATYAPAGLPLVLHLNLTSVDANAGGTFVRFSDLSQADIAAAVGVTQVGIGTAATGASGNYRVRCNASRQFRVRATGVNSSVYWSVDGWIDPRGKLG